jgi:hypothetical protein
LNAIPHWIFSQLRHFIPRKPDAVRVNEESLTRGQRNEFGDQYEITFPKQIRRDSCSHKRRAWIESLALFDKPKESL